MLTVVDEATCEALRIHVDYFLKSQGAQQVVGKLFRERVGPCYLRSDIIEKTLSQCLKFSNCPRLARLKVGKAALNFSERWAAVS